MSQAGAGPSRRPPALSEPSNGRGRASLVTQCHKLPPRTRWLPGYTGAVGWPTPGARLAAGGSPPLPWRVAPTSGHFFAALIAARTAPRSIAHLREAVLLGPDGHSASRAQVFLASQARPRPPQPDRHPASVLRLVPVGRAARDDRRHLTDRGLHRLARRRIRRVRVRRGPVLDPGVP